MAQCPPPKYAPGHSIVRALQVKLYSNWPGARVVCFAGRKDFEGNAYAADTIRIRNAAAIW